MSSRERKARKDHKCIYCGETIPKGEVYIWEKGIYDGDIYEWHEHKKCYEVCNAIWDYVDADPDEGMTDQDFQDGCCEVCRCFICPDCPKYDNDTGECEDDVTYCIDKMAEFFQSHEFYREGRDKYGRERWKVRDKGR